MVAVFHLSGFRFFIQNFMMQAEVATELIGQFYGSIIVGEWKKINWFTVKPATGFRKAAEMEYDISFMPSTIVGYLAPCHDELVIFESNFEDIRNGNLDPTFLVGKSLLYQYWYIS